MCISDWSSDVCSSDLGGRTSLGLPAILKGCIAGCESVERTGENAYEALVAVKIGPVSTRFKGKLRMNDGQPPHSYTIHFDGQGGVAGFGKGSADVALAAEIGRGACREKVVTDV